MFQTTSQKWFQDNSAAKPPWFDDSFRFSLPTRWWKTICRAKERLRRAEINASPQINTSTRCGAASAYGFHAFPSSYSEMAVANHRFESQLFDMVWCDFFEWGIYLISRGYFFCLPIQLNTFWKLDQLHRSKITKPSPTKSQGMVATKPALVTQSPSKIVPRKNNSGLPVD